MCQDDPNCLKIPATFPTSEILYVFLSGSLKKGDSDTRDPSVFWDEEKERRIVKGVTGRRVVILNPMKFDVARKDYFANFGCDLHYVSISHVLLVDLTAKKGIGIGAEMMYAQMQGVTVIGICPSSSFYKPGRVTGFFGQDVDNWIHPFVFGLSDYIVETLDEAIEVLSRLKISDSPLRKADRVSASIKHYFRTREMRS